MFTGIIESLGQISNISTSGSNKTFWVQSGLSSSLKVDQSLCHDGVCLTVEEIDGNRHRVTAVLETLEKTSLNQWKPGTFVNLERSLSLSSRLDGHFVQGHVDATGKCTAIMDRQGSYEFEISFPENFAALVIEKGSICVNGVSLTAWDVKGQSLKVAVIPYTYQHTNFQIMKMNDPVNLEFDMIGKYILRNISLKK
jgi:riboflavin synthase